MTVFLADSTIFCLSLHVVVVNVFFVNIDASSPTHSLLDSCKKRNIKELETSWIHVHRKKKNNPKIPCQALSLDLLPNQLKFGLDFASVSLPMSSEAIVAKRVDMLHKKPKGIYILKVWHGEGLLVSLL